jgi:hypothetical protein
VRPRSASRRSRTVRRSSGTSAPATRSIRASRMRLSMVCARAHERTMGRNQIQMPIHLY